MNESTSKVNAGLSREQAKKVLQSFLENENDRVLALKGKWGVGKTYLVQDFLSKKYYYYASVFGLSSIEQLKARILANYKNSLETKNQDPQTRNEPLLNSINKIITNVFEGVNRNYEKIKGTPKLDVVLPGQSTIPIAGSLVSIAGDLLLNALFNLNAPNAIICIDDLERKSKLSLDEILGFVEYLVKELNCKIILIYDEDNLDQESLKILNQYREKVFHKEVNLTPTVEENLDFIFRDNSDLDVIKEVLVKAETNNIRVLHKTKYLLDEFISLMDNWQPSLRNQIIRNSILINLAKLDTEFQKSFPGVIDIILPFLKDDSNTKESDNKTLDKAIDRIKAIGRNQYLGYRALETDKYIIQLVETSFFESDEFINQGNTLNQKEQKNPTIGEKLNILTKLYSDSFADNEKEIHEAIIKFFEDYHLELSISEFDEIQNFASLMEIETNKYEKSLLKDKLTKTIESNSFSELQVFQSKLNKYPDLQEYLEKKKSEYQQKLNITTALINVIKNSNYLISTWLEAEIAFLNNRTLEEYSQWLKEGHRDLHLSVKQFLKLGLPASQKLEQAIRKLAKESKLNKIRAKYLYNIDIDSPTNSNLVS